MVISNAILSLNRINNNWDRCRHFILSSLLIPFLGTRLVFVCFYFYFYLLGFSFYNIKPSAQTTRPYPFRLNCQTPNQPNSLMVAQAIHPDLLRPQPTPTSSHLVVSPQIQHRPCLKILAPPTSHRIIGCSNLGFNQSNSSNRINLFN